jgi:hypothetical protein
MTLPSISSITDVMDIAQYSTETNSSLNDAESKNHGHTFSLSPPRSHYQSVLNAGQPAPGSSAPATAYRDRSPPNQLVSSASPYYYDPSGLHMVEHMGLSSLPTSEYPMLSPDTDYSIAEMPGNVDRMSIDGITNPQLGSFHCTFPRCSAPPFQTQYLLNSHANVHSSSRPHYCPVSGCARSEGGKGFKRKNEMIRHGLVHESPGYICPYCIDREHRYPRPDNLQRYVSRPRPRDSLLTWPGTFVCTIPTRTRTILSSATYSRSGWRGSVAIGGDEAGCFDDFGGRGRIGQAMDLWRWLAWVYHTCAVAIFITGITGRH